MQCESGLEIRLIENGKRLTGVWNAELTVNVYPTIGRIDVSVNGFSTVGVFEPCCHNYFIMSVKFV